MDPYLAEIRMFAGNFAPRNWAFCNGQLMAISQNTALFSLLGTTYGGNGTTTFALPNLQGAAPMHAGQGIGLSDRVLGEESGTTTVTLNSAEMAAHSHALHGNTTLATSDDPSGAIYARGETGGTPATQVWPYTTAAPDTNMSATALSLTGGGLPHNNVMPYLTVNFIIALAGVFPPRG
jgi:microcystin-dependent protein